MKVLLLDADSTIPNVALMKLSAYHKSQGDEVTLKELHIPYYPSRTIFNAYYNAEIYDKVYCSVIFDSTLQHLKRGSTIFGGTGYSLSFELPLDIEGLEPDYSLYPNNDTSYGFITRGCIRNCSFCKVPQKEGGIRQVSNVDRIVRHKVTKFLDNNILAFPGHYDILQELVDKKIRCQFNQGLDIRLIDERNSLLLSQMNYYKEYIFAFDDIRYMSLIDHKLDILSWRKKWQFKFFVYVHPDMPLEETTERVMWLKEHECLPYLMRDIACWSSLNRTWYANMAAWCNQPGLFKNMDFKTFVERRS